jgi:predicted HicB family RNase H-like nuclease
MTHTDSNGAQKRVDGAVTGEATHYVGVRMPQELQEWLVDLAKRERTSLNAQVVVLLERVREQTVRSAHDR